MSLALFTNQSVVVEDGRRSWRRRYVFSSHSSREIVLLYVSRFPFYIFYLGRAHPSTSKHSLTHSHLWTGVRSLRLKCKLHLTTEYTEGVSVRLRQGLERCMCNFN